MKYLYLIFCLFIFSSCEMINNCDRVRCSSGEIVSPAFTIRNNVENLIQSKKIGLNNIVVKDLDTLPIKTLQKFISNAEEDTFFRINLIENQKSIRLSWSSDSVDISINYKKLKSVCCPDQLKVENMTVDGVDLVTSGGIIIVKK